MRYEALAPVLDERGRRRFAAAEASTAGRGGVLALTRITGLARSTIDRGLRELAGAAMTEVAPGRTRRPGGGRKKLTETDPTLLADLQSLVEPTTRGDPIAPLLWTSRSLRNLADALQVMGHRIKHNVVADLLRQLDYSLQSNRKTREGSSNPDRDAQFAYINAQMKAALTAGQPAISVDTRRGTAAKGRALERPSCAAKGQPEPVRVHDFRIPELGRAVPYGVASLATSAG